MTHVPNLRGGRVKIFSRVGYLEVQTSTWRPMSWAASRNFTLLERCAVSGVVARHFIIIITIIITKCRSNGSIPTLERVRREESNHSIGSHSQTSSGQVDNDDDDGDAATDVDDDNEQAQYWFSQTSSGKLTRILGNFGIGNIYKKLISQVCRSMLIGEGGYLNEFIVLCVEIWQLKQQRSFDEL